ncbi:MAG: hypothetical protein JWO83_1564 [Caulobacteraceae bacterium]|jgi:pimeloyl-ACP methyl ester carboxylesterase|nr:hypothetical protein [Caulobacteraceae bacterium]
MTPSCLDMTVPGTDPEPPPLAAVQVSFKELGANPETHRDVRQQLAGPRARAVLDDLVAVGHVETAVHCPVVLIGGAKDTFATPELIESVIRPRFPAAALTFVTNAGHWPHIERPDAIAGIVATFLATLNEAASASGLGNNEAAYRRPNLPANGAEV